MAGEERKPRTHGWFSSLGGPKWKTPATFVASHEHLHTTDQSYMHVCSYYANANAIAVPRSMCLVDIQISGGIKVSIMKGRRSIGQRGSSHQVRVIPRGQATGRSAWTDRASIIRKWPAGKRRPPAGGSVHEGNVGVATWLSWSGLARLAGLDRGAGSIRRTSDAKLLLQLACHRRRDM